MSELSAGFESEARGIFGLPLGVLVRDLKFGIAPAHLCSNSIWHCPPTRAKSLSPVFRRPESTPQYLVIVFLTRVLGSVAVFSVIYRMECLKARRAVRCDKGSVSVSIRPSWE